MLFATQDLTCTGLELQISIPVIISGVPILSEAFRWLLAVGTGVWQLGASQVQEWTSHRSQGTFILAASELQSGEIGGWPSQLGLDWSPLPCHVDQPASQRTCLVLPAKGGIGHATSSLRYSIVHLRYSTPYTPGYGVRTLLLQHHALHRSLTRLSSVQTQH